MNDFSVFQGCFFLILRNVSGIRSGGLRDVCEVDICEGAISIFQGEAFQTRNVRCGLQYSGFFDEITSNCCARGLFFGLRIVLHLGFIPIGGYGSESYLITSHDEWVKDRKPNTKAMSGSKATGRFLNETRQLKRRYSFLVY